MNKALFITLLLITFFSFGQDYTSEYKKAVDLYEAKAYNKAIDIALPILTLAEQENNMVWTARTKLLIGESHFKLGKYTETIKYLNQFNKINKDQQLEAYANALLGDVYKKNKEITLSITHYKNAYNTYLKLDDNLSAIQIALDIANLYTKNRKYNDAKTWIDLGLKVTNENNFSKLKLSFLVLKGKSFSNFGDYSSSIKVFEKALLLAQQLNDKKQEVEINSYIETVTKNIETSKLTETKYTKEKEAYKAKVIDSLSYLSAKSISEIESLSEEIQLSAYRLKALADEYEKQILTERLEKLEKEKALELTQSKLTLNQALLVNEQVINEKQKTRVIALALSITLVIIILLLVYRALIKKKANNLVLLDKNKTILEQKQSLEKKSNQINDSIAYAKLIQNSILPTADSLSQTHNQLFLFFKPKDIVSGDFYWHYSIGDYVYLAVIDCTGHGVPGAFMSLICHNIIERVIRKNNTIKPAELLTKADYYLSETFKRYATDQHDIKDGMDLSLIRINKKTNELLFSGARNPLYIIRKGLLTELKGNKKSIGSIGSFNVEAFENQNYQLEKNDMLYMFSDGYIDQKGGPKNKKLYFKPFRNLLTKIAELPLADQKNYLENHFKSWSSENEQIDDVTVVGLRI